METLKSLKLITRHGDHWISFDQKDGFYSLAIAPQDKEAFTVNLDGQLLQLCMVLNYVLEDFLSSECEAQNRDSPRQVVALQSSRKQAMGKR